jgi:phosphate uptake regulator
MAEVTEIVLELVQDRVFLGRIVGKAQDLAAEAIALERAKETPDPTVIAELNNVIKMDIVNDLASMRKIAGAILNDQLAVIDPLPTSADQVRAYDDITLGSLVLAYWGKVTGQG